LRIAVKVKPNSRIDEVIQQGDILAVKTKEPPREGKANNAVIRLAAKFYKVPQGAVRIVSGLNSRNKVIEISGL
jgi:uncharacterized protein (TIGR00251 family)